MFKKGDKRKDKIESTIIAIVIPQHDQLQILQILPKDLLKST